MQPLQWGEDFQCRPNPHLRPSALSLHLIYFSFMLCFIGSIKKKKLQYEALQGCNPLSNSTFTVDYWLRHKRGVIVLTKVVICFKMLSSIKLEICEVICKLRSLLMTSTGPLQDW